MLQRWRFTPGKSKGLAHGEQLLDLLDSVRDGLLAGASPRHLNKLAAAVTRAMKAFGRSKLQDVLDQIRAACPCRACET